MTTTTPEDLDAAHSLLMLSRHAVNFANTQRQRSHVQDSRLRTETQLERLQQHHALGTSTTTDPTPPIRGRLPPAPAASAPRTPQPPHPQEQDTVIPPAFSLNRTVTQTFCPHISSARKPECVAMTCDHFCCHKSHNIWQDHLTGQGPNHFQQLQEAQPRSRLAAAPQAKKKAPGRPRKYPVQPQNDPPAPSHQHHSATAAPFPVNAHNYGMAPQYGPTSPYGMYMGGVHMSAPFPAVYDMTHGLLLGRSGFAITPTRLATPSSYQARQGPMGSGFQPFPSALQQSQLRSPAPQDPQYGILRQAQGGGLLEHTMRTMQAEQPVFDFRRPLPLAQRRQAQSVDLAEGEGMSTQMAGAQGSIADAKVKSEVMEEHDVRKGRAEAGGSSIDEK